MTKPKDHTGCLIICMVFGCVFFFLLGVSVEILKFVALIKWVIG